MHSVCVFICFFFQAEDGIRDLVRSRGLGDVYKRQNPDGYIYNELSEPEGGGLWRKNRNNIDAPAGIDILSLIHI